MGVGVCTLRTRLRPIMPPLRSTLRGNECVSSKSRMLPSPSSTPTPPELCNSPLLLSSG